MRKLLWFFYYQALLMLDGLVLLAVPKAQKTPSLLLIRLDLIGDFVIWLDAAQHFRRLYPAHSITLLAHPSWAELAQQLPHWDEVITVDSKRLIRSPLYRWRIMYQLRRKGFAMAIQPAYSRVCHVGDSLVRITGAPIRIGFDGDLSNISVANKRRADRWYTHLAPARTGLLMELERNAEFVSYLACHLIQPKLPVLPVMSAVPPAPTVPYCILFPGASWSGRCWPAERFAAVGRLLRERFGWQILVCGSAAEAALCGEVANAIGGAADNRAGKTSLVELVELVRGAALLVGNETSAVHIAAAVNTPSVCILGGGHYGRFIPYSIGLKGKLPVAAVREMSCFHCNWACTQSHVEGDAVPCVQGVSVAQVFELACQVS